MAPVCTERLSIGDGVAFEIGRQIGQMTFGLTIIAAIAGVFFLIALGIYGRAWLKRKFGTPKWTS